MERDGETEEASPITWRAMARLVGFDSGGRAFLAKTGGDRSLFIPLSPKAGLLTGAWRCKGIGNPSRGRS